MRSPRAARSRTAPPAPAGGTRASGPPSPVRRTRRAPPAAARRRCTPPAPARRRPRAPRSPRESAAAIPLVPPPRGRARRGSRRGSAERALQLVEEALVLRVRIFVRQALEFLEQPSLLVRQPMRHRDVDEHAMVPAAEALQHGHAAAGEDAGLARLRPGGELELARAVERLDRDVRPESGLDDVQIHRREDVVALAHEARVGLHADAHVDIARASPELAGVALAADPDLLAVVDPLRDLHVDTTLLHRATRAFAGGARGRHDLASASAAGTRLRPDELAEDAAADLLDAPRATARRAVDQARSRLCARGAAPRAGNGDAERHLARRSTRGLDELDLDLGGDVRAAGAPSAAGSAEQVVAEEGGEDVGDAPEVEVAGREAAAAQPGMAVAVVELARLRVGQHLVRLGDLAEPRLRIRLARDVGVQLARELPERALDVLLVPSARNLEQLVVIALGRGHRPSLPRRRLRRNGRARRPRNGPSGSPCRSPSAPARAGSRCRAIGVRARTPLRRARRSRALEARGRRRPARTGGEDRANLGAA